MDNIKKLLEEKAREACARFGLHRVYFARPLGRRRHFLAGAGHETFLPAQSAFLFDNLVVFWVGEMKNQEKFLKFLKQEVRKYVT
mgnify:FL=1|jgi:hypothetical protein